MYRLGTRRPAKRRTHLPTTQRYRPVVPSAPAPRSTAQTAPLHRQPPGPRRQESAREFCQPAFPLGLCTLLPSGCRKPRLGPGAKRLFAPVSYLHCNKGSRSIGERHREGQSYIPINSRYLAQKSRVDENRAQEPYPGAKPHSADQFGPARAQTISIRISSTQKTIAGITLIALAAPDDGRKSGHTKSAHCC